MRGDEEFHIDVWCRELGGLTQNEITLGVRDSARLNWAPSVGAFRKLCRPPKINSSAYKQNQTYKALSNYKPGSIAGKLAISKIRHMLGMPQVDRDNEGNIIVDREK